jgi:hypothetical protein
MVLALGAGLMIKGERDRHNLYDEKPSSSRRSRRKDERHDANPRSRIDERRHRTSSRRYHSSTSWRNNRDGFGYHSQDREDTSLQQLQQRNTRLLFLAALILSAITWMNLFHETTNSQIQTRGSDSKKATRTGDSVAGLEKSTVRDKQTFSSSNNMQSPIKHQSKKQQQPTIKEDIKQILAEERTSRKRWNPCSSKYELERHDHEPRHGDICRIKGGIMSYFECPHGCHETGGNPPYCAQHTVNLSGGSKPCRARDPKAAPEYRCDDVGVCILAVGSPKEQFKGKGVYYDDSCDGMCGERNDTASFVKSGQNSVGCTSDLDCSLAGICLPETKTCLCDAWADGADCSYLKFQPVNKSRLGYMNEHYSSWGGSIVYSSKDQMYHMFVSEIVCKDDLQTRKRCGLSSWETHSRVVIAESADIDGPYLRNITDEAALLPPEHHNPSIHVAPNGEWHLFTISGSTGPIERMVSSDQGTSWSEPVVISPRQNPGPLLRPDGSTYLYYRADGMDLPSPTCSNEGLAMQICPVAQTCHPPNDIPLFGHTGEDPSVFVDHRGNYHMLFNALPYKCAPKFNQGGHAWSKDGITWNSNPRVGAFTTTVQFTDGTSIKCERRERPQMVVGSDGKPIAFVTGLTGCPKGLMLSSNDNDEMAEKSGAAVFYRGGDDSFTMVQLMAT